MKKYIAYGSNLNLGQMRHRCPTAAILGIGFLENWTLTFRSMRGPAYATIEPCIGSQVPVVVWNIDKIAERALDRYEGYPHFYSKTTIKVSLNNGLGLDAMVYIMNRRASPGVPSEDYIDTIYQGYLDNDLNMHYLGGFLEIH